MGDVLHPALCAAIKEYATSSEMGVEPTPLLNAFNAFFDYFNYCVVCSEEDASLMHGIKILRTILAGAKQ